MAVNNRLSLSLGFSGQAPSRTCDDGSIVNNSDTTGTYAAAEVGHLAILVVNLAIPNRRDTW